MDADGTVFGIWEQVLEVQTPPTHADEIFYPSVEMIWILVTLPIYLHVDQAKKLSCWGVKWVGWG